MMPTPYLKLLSKVLTMRGYYGQTTPGDDIPQSEQFKSGTIKSHRFGRLNFAGAYALSTACAPMAKVRTDPLGPAKSRIIGADEGGKLSSERLEKWC